MQPPLKLFVANLPFETIREDIEAFFTQVCGSKVIAQKGKNKGKKNKKTAIIILPNQQCFDLVSKASLTFKGLKLLLKPFLPSDKRLIQIARMADRRVLINVAPKTISDKELLQSIGPFGEIEEVFFQRTKATNKLKTAFVTFYDPESANRAVQARLIASGKFRLKISHYKISQQNLMKLESFGDDYTKEKLNDYANQLIESSALSSKINTEQLVLLNRKSNRNRNGQVHRGQPDLSGRLILGRPSIHTSRLFQGHHNHQLVEKIEDSFKGPFLQANKVLRVLYHPESSEYIRFNRNTIQYNTQRTIRPLPKNAIKRRKLKKQKTPTK